MKKNNLNFIIILINIFLFIGTFFAFYNMAQFKEGDLSLHYQFAIDLLKLKDETIINFSRTVELSHILSYPIWHILFLLIQSLLQPAAGIFQYLGLSYYESISAIGTSMFILLTFNIYIKIFTTYLVGNNRLRGVLFSMLLLFTGPWYFPFINDKYALGQGIVTPWHNPTTLAVQPIAILCFFLFIKLYEHRQAKKKENRGFFLFSFLLLISAFFKPSFYQMFVPALVLFCIIEFLIKRDNFWFCFKTALAVIPVCVLALVQMFISLGSTNNGISFGVFTVLKVFTNHPVASIFISLIFPFCILGIACKNGMIDKKLRLSACCLVSGLGQFSLLYLQQGTMAGDFAWGFYLSLQMLFICSLIYFYNICRIKSYKKVKYLGWAIYFPHVMFGFVYFLNLLHMGYNYLGPLYFIFK